MKIDTMRREDASEVIRMMREFYASPAVHTDGSEEIFARDVACCVGRSPYLKGFVLREGGRPVGYAMAAQSFSTEFGKKCVWIEDIYIRPEYRGRGWGEKTLAFLEKKYAGRLLRLEADAENAGALRLYRRCGFEIVPYAQLKKDAEKE